MGEEDGPVHRMIEVHPRRVRTKIYKGVKKWGVLHGKRIEDGIVSEE